MLHPAFHGSGHDRTLLFLPHYPLLNYLYPTSKPGGHVRAEAHCMVGLGSEASTWLFMCDLLPEAALSKPSKAMCNLLPEAALSKPSKAMCNSLPEAALEEAQQSHVQLAIRSSSRKASRLLLTDMSGLWVSSLKGRV